MFHYKFIRVPHLTSIRFPTAIQPEGIKVFRFDADIFFVNSHVFEHQVHKRCFKPGVRHIILNFAPVNHVDSTGIEALQKLFEVTVVGYRSENLFIPTQILLIYSIYAKNLTCASKSTNLYSYTLLISKLHELLIFSIIVSILFIQYARGLEENRFICAKLILFILNLLAQVYCYWHFLL